MVRQRYLFAVAVLGVVCVCMCGGCHITHPDDPLVAAPAIDMDETPRELYKATLPKYRIEPPDILVIQATKMVPRPPYRLQIQDVVTVDVLVSPELPNLNIQGSMPVSPDGSINLGAFYGTVKVAGMTVNEAREAVEKFVNEQVKAESVSLELQEMAGMQPIAGEHLVGPDGTVNLGTYGSVSVVGMTIEEAKAAVEKHLTKYLADPEVTLDVYSYNSKKYYVVTEGAGLGDTITSFPVTGNETVLDAIANVNGLQQVSSKRIWIARPSRDPGKIQILPVDWRSITAQASTGTNYQIMPGDRIFIAQDELIAFDNGLGKLIAPFERVMGFALLGAGTLTRFTGKVLQGGGNPRGSGGGF